MRPRSVARYVFRRIWPPKPKPLILMYHQIADERADHWRLAVSPAHFEEQLVVLRRTRRPLRLLDFVSDLNAGTLRSDAVALTFDDGYVDNLISGKPRLAAADVPATVVLATGYLDRPGEFWWDELARLILYESGPQSFELIVRGHAMQFDLGSASLTRDDGTQADRLRGRRAVLTAIWEAVRRLEDEERDLIMTELRSTFSVRGCHIDRSRAMTREEVRQLVRDGLVTIGAHTVTHPVLSGLRAADCDREVTESKIDLRGPYGRTRFGVFLSLWRCLCACSRRGRGRRLHFWVFLSVRANRWDV